MTQMTHTINTEVGVDVTSLLTGRVASLADRVVSLLVRLENPQVKARLAPRIEAKVLTINGSYLLMSWRCST